MTKQRPVFYAIRPMSRFPHQPASPPATKQKGRHTHLLRLYERCDVFQGACPALAQLHGVERGAEEGFQALRARRRGGRREAAWARCMQQGDDTPCPPAPARTAALNWAGRAASNTYIGMCVRRPPRRGEARQPQRAHLGRRLVNIVDLIRIIVQVVQLIAGCVRARHSSVSGIPRQMATPPCH